MLAGVETGEKGRRSIPEPEPATARPRIRFSSRVLGIQPSPTLAVLGRATELIARGVDIVDFGPGEPDFQTPASIGAAAKRAIDDGHTKYTNTCGSDSLRNAIAATYNSRYDCDLTKENVVAGTGGKQELFNVTLSLVSDGDEVIIPCPYWVSFPDQVSFAGGSPVFAMTDPSRGFRPTASVIEPLINGRTRGVILNSPCNPTGAVIEEAELEKIAQLCHDNGMFLLFDETYEFFVYEGAHVSAMRWFQRFPETIIVVNSMSKTFSMTGWRLGFAIAHREIIGMLAKIQSHSTSNPCSISQIAATEALRSGSDEVQKMHRAYTERRNWLVPAINAIEGFDCPMPDGAFYLFPRVDAFYGRSGITGSASLTNYLLEEARVSVVPGEAFGADDYLRISYATSLENLREGVARISAAVGKL